MLRIKDVYIDLLTHVLILECDENQHKTYEEICENKRTMELFNDFGSRPIVFIRFNPDSYTQNDIKYPSSFKYHKALDVPVINDKKEWEFRLNTLKTYVDNHLAIIPEKEITIEYLFYNEIN